MASQFEHGPRRPRAASAKPSQEKNRPSSGHSHHRTSKIEFIENLYQGTGPSRTAKLAPKVRALGQEPLLLTTAARGPTPQEQLYEENLHLKKEINGLRKELELQRGRTEAFRRKHSEQTRGLQLEFEKELYWAGSNANMVRGVKTQYELIKEKYEAKCHELETLAREPVLAQNREDRTYLSALQDDNRKLRQALEQADQEMRLIEHGTITSAVEETLEENAKRRFELLLVTKALREQVQTQELQRKGLARGLEEAHRKVAFLQKLLIERDNAEHAARRKAKKLEREKQDLLEALAAAKDQEQATVAVLEGRLRRAQLESQRLAEQEMAIFRQELGQKDERIAALEKEVAYLSTLLGYWKPLDDIKALPPNPALSNDSQEILLEYSVGSTMIRLNKSGRRDSQNLNAIHIEDEDGLSRSLARGSRRGSTEARPLLDRQAEALTKSIALTPAEQEGVRVQVTADRRFSQEGVKCRRVQREEVLDICETLKYRFIGFGVGIDQVRQFFDYCPREEDILQTQEEEDWQRQFITMAEAEAVLRSGPYFCLSPPDARLLARYLVEDSQNDYVYCDPANENLRTIVKAIVKQEIGSYELFADPEGVGNRAQDLLHRYQTNLEPALLATAPKGLIPKKKLLQLFKGLGIELSAEVSDYLLGQLAIVSTDLSSLHYQHLFAR